VAIRLVEIAQHVQATLQGDAELQISAIAALSSALAGELSFIVEPKYLANLKTTKASAVIMTRELSAHWVGNALLVDDPYLAYAKAAELFKKPTGITSGIHDSVSIGANCQIDPSASIAANVVLGDRVTLGKNVSIGANTVVGNDCSLAANCELKANVTLCDSVTLGKACIVHNGAVLGCDGFGNANDHGRWYKIPQLGGVRIGNDVEIGANSTIDCGALGDTIIEDGVRIDNLVQIAHNVSIGAHTAIAACCGISGSTKIGRHCMLAGQVGIAGHLEICDKVILTGKAMVTRSITKPGIYSSGTGIMDNTAWRKSIVHFRNLDKLVKKIKQLQKNSEVNDELAIRC